MFNLEGAIVDLIVGWYSMMVMGISNLVEMAMLGPAQFNDVIWELVQKLSQNAILPVSYALMTAFLLVELFTMINKGDGIGRQENLFFFFRFAIKLFVAKLFMDNVMLIINMIFSMGADILSKFDYAYDLTSQAHILDTTMFADQVSNLGFWELLMTLLGAFLFYLGNVICTLLAQGIIIMRFIEIYVYSAIAPLGISTMASEEYSSIGKNMIKKFCALSLHAILLVIVLYCYQILVSEATFNLAIYGAGDVIIAFGQMLLYTIVCVIAMFQTGGWSKSITGAS